MWRDGVVGWGWGHVACERSGDKAATVRVLVLCARISVHACVPTRV